MVPGVGHSDKASASRHGHAPGIEELSIPVSMLSKSQEEASLRSEDLDSVVILVRHEQAVSDDIVGDSSGAVELSRSRSTATEGLDEVALRRVNKNLVLKTIRNQKLETRINRETALVRFRMTWAPCSAGLLRWAMKSGIVLTSSVLELDVIPQGLRTRKRPSDSISTSSWTTERGVAE